MASRLDCNSTTVLSEGEQLVLNGAEISLNRKIYFISHPVHVKKLEKIAEVHVEKSDFVLQLARGAHIAVVERPDLTFGFAHAF